MSDTSNIYQNFVGASNVYPWNPVAIKKVDPYTPSEIVKVASIYSYTWNPVNVIARTIVKNKAILAGSLRPTIISWCAHVTVAPDNNKINVFNNGTPQGLKGLILVGGQTDPISTAGDKLAWKNAQKKAKKNITSERINKIIPNLKPTWTVFVWCPLYVASRITSLHQTVIDDIIINKPNTKILLPYWKECINIAAPIAVTKHDTADTSGHGLGSTKWNGCFWIELIIL